MTVAQIDTPYQVITDRMLALLEQDTVPWRTPWDSVTGVPRNLFSQRPYRGINVWLLTAMGYTSPFWATFSQVKTAGSSVRKGARRPGRLLEGLHQRRPSNRGRGEALCAQILHGVQRRTARRRSRAGDRRDPVQLHPHRAVCPARGRHAAPARDLRRPPAGLLHACHGYAASA